MTDWREVVINCLQVVSILSAGAFAALALFTNYKEEGKVTRYGRIAVIGIVLSLLCSLGTRWAQSDLDRDRSHAASIIADGQRKADNIQFRGQLATLVGLSNLQHQSLLAQQRLLAQANATIEAVESARSQEDRNTEQTLQTMWEDANRIGTDSVDVIVRYSCQRRPGSTVPYLFRQDAIANLYIKPLNESPFRHQLRSLHTTQVQLEPFGRSENHIENVVTFDRFFGSAMQALSRPDSWRRSAISLSISARFSDNLADLQATLAEPFLDMTNVPTSINGAQRRDIVAVLPCPASASLFVNNRFIVDFRLYPIVFRHNDQYRITMQSDPLRVPEDAFPRFAAP